MKYMWIVAVLVLFAACSPAQQEQSLHDRVPDVHGEILYHDVFSEAIPADEIAFFGIMIGDSEENITALHGTPDTDSEYQFGVIRNLEYEFDQENTTVVLYHLERGVVRAVLITADAHELLGNETIFSRGREHVYELFGVPTVSQELHLERALYYGNLGYTFFIPRSGVDRVYFAAPQPLSDEVCAQVITPAINDEEICAEFRTPCDVPTDWTVVDSCEEYNSFEDDNTTQPQVVDVTDANQAPQISI